MCAPRICAQNIWADVILEGGGPQVSAHKFSDAQKCVRAYNFCAAERAELPVPTFVTPKKRADLPETFRHIL